MDKSDGQRMVEAFHYVRDVYRNIGRMLLSCDALMEGKGYATDPKWISVWPDRTLALAPGNISDTWLPCFVIRQYYSIADHFELITIGAVTWDFFSPQFDMPLCVASRMLVHDSSPNALMWISVLQMWDTTTRPDGEVRVLSGASADYTEENRKEIAQLVRGGRILSMACPLLEISDTDLIEKRLISPLLKRYLAELVPPSDVTEEQCWLRTAAEQGNADCQVNLGCMYRDGRGVAQDDTEAVNWFRKAVEQGNALGQAHFGWMCEMGKGVESNVAEAIMWYRKAAEQGSEYAVQNLKRLGAVFSQE